MNFKKNYLAGIKLGTTQKTQAFLSSPGEITIELGHIHPLAFL